METHRDNRGKVSSSGVRWGSNSTSRGLCFRVPEAHNGPAQTMLRYRVTESRVES